MHVSNIANNTKTQNNYHLDCFESAELEKSVRQSYNELKNVVC